MFDAVSRLCKKKGISISELEKRLELGNGTIYKWKTSSPRVDNLQKVAKALGVSVNRLLREK